MNAFRLRDVVEHLPGCRVHGADVELTGIAIDSRLVRPGDVFAVLPGVGVHGRLDGHDFIPQALTAGAAALLLPAEDQVPADTSCLLSANARRDAGLLAQLLLGEPGRRLRLLAVTGTNGKSSCAHLLQHLLGGEAESWGLLSTLRSETGSIRVSTHTTPDPVSLARLMSESLAAGQVGLAMELSSHALDQERAAGCVFAGVLYTNISRDHLDYHGDMESYVAAKVKLLALRGDAAPALINIDDARLAQLHDGGAADMLSYGRAEGADYRIIDEELDVQGASFSLAWQGGRMEFRSPLPGAFNVSNAAGALALLLSLGHEPERLARRLRDFPGVPGRLELVHLPGGPMLVIDFAHTPDAVEKVLQACRPLCPGRLHALFGAGGDKDRGKRPLMGQAVQSAADVIWLTSDNPRSEDPRDIIADVESGMDRSAGSWHKEVDRALAIARALADCGEDDWLVLLGKGHEEIQEIAGEIMRFSDREVAKEAWRSMGGHEEEER